MTRVVALIDGEHYPPVVRAALASLAHEYEVAAVAFLGGTEKIDLAQGFDTYGVPLVHASTPEEALAEAIDRYEPCAVIDLSDEPVVTSADRFRLASVAIARGVEYRGADFHFSPPRMHVTTTTPALGIIGTGKRVGKTAVSAYVARELRQSGRDIVVVAMGRGGPSEPELIRGDQVALTTSDLLELARQGIHSASDNYEDAVMSRVTTIGCRRCGGGMAGDTYYSNVPEGARLADRLGKELVIFEGSGAAIPPTQVDATVLVVSAGRGVGYVRDYFGPHRLDLADLVIIASAEAPIATAAEAAAIRAEIERIRPDVAVVSTTFRPEPIESVAGKRVFFATTAPEAALPTLTAHLERVHGCEVVGVSAHLSDRALLRVEMAAAAGTFDVLLTELKAAAIDVVAEVGADTGVPTVLCDNVPVSVDGTDLSAAVDAVASTAIARGRARGGRST